MPGAAVRSFVLLVVALAATIAFRALGTTTLFEDGPLLVDLLSNIRDRPPLWYHAAYVPLAWALEFVTGRGHVASALLWASALSGALGLAVFAATALRRAPTPSGALVFVALAAAPGLWANATRIEVHATQFLGAAVLLWAAVRHAEGAAWRTRTWLALAAALAVTSHNSHLVALPGAAWIAVDRRAEGPFMRRLVHAALPLAVGAALGWWLNGRADVLPASADSIRYLLTEFFVGPSVALVREEVLRLWATCPVVFALVVASRAAPIAALRAAAPYLAAGAPSFALFASLGIWTSGGYFTTSMLFLAGAGIAAAREPARWKSRPLIGIGLVATSAVVLVAAAAIQVGVVVSSSLRTGGKSLADARFAATCELLPNGGLLISVENSTCSINGRDLRWREQSLVEPFSAALHIGESATSVVDDLLVKARGSFATTPLLVDASYESDALASSLIGPAMGVFLDGFDATHTRRRVERSGRTFVHLVPRESP